MYISVKTKRFRGTSEVPELRNEFRRETVASGVPALSLWEPVGLNFGGYRGSKVRTGVGGTRWCSERSEMLRGDRRLYE